MKDIIYFPTFEPPTTNWLKFALLYFDSFNPIIPYRKEKDLSDNYRRIIDETDLIHPYDPKYNQGYRASLNASEFMEKVLKDPYQYANLFNSPNIIRNIQDKNNWSYKIYEEKYSSGWEYFCKEHLFGETKNDGLLVSEELAFIYMTFLAEEIAFEEEKSIITDNIKFDNFLNFKKITSKSIYDEQNFAQGVINLSIPENISNISIPKLITFRKNNEKLIKSFNQELNIFLDNIQKEINEKDFVDRFNGIYKELTKEIGLQFFNLIVIPLSAYILFQNPLSTNIEYLNQIVGGLGITIGAKQNINSKWKDIVNKHNCRRYLTNLSKLQ
ncbi:hypothetical protein FACS189451_11760 [Bacteroidia bacterium]|nr:hypothetical protein FACS189446_4090 [Bacteroidia bacterium]GHT64267.1 hypothetical protein FACS189451_11760 [Bacteroidia bacterium]